MPFDYLYSSITPLVIKNISMPIAKNPFERYKIIDKHLKRNKGFTIKELTEIVNEELRMFDRNSNPNHSREVSDRMIRIDIQNMPQIFPIEIIKKGSKYYYENVEDLDQKTKNEMFGLYQMVTLFISYNAQKEKKLREVFGIKKGFFSR
jgi:hypothetical protein